MISALVVADDVTGGHASAEALRGSAAPVSVVVSAKMTCEQHEVLAGVADVIVCATGTRNAARAHAIGAVRQALRQWWPAAHVAKRIDSTLRGHVGAEVECVVRELATLSGRRVFGLVCPAYPSAGRTTVGGRQYLHGLPLDASPASRATIEPLDRSRILSLLQGDGGLRGTEVYLAAVRRGADEELAAALADGLDIVVFDSETLDDVDRLAAACAAFAERHPDVLVVSVDPGPFTARLHHHRTSGVPDAQRAHDSRAATGAARSDLPVLAVVGSASDLTRRQLRTLVDRRKTWPVHVVDVAPSGRGVRPAGDVVRELTESASAARSGDVILLTTTTVEGHGDYADSALSEILPRTLGQVVRSFLETRRVAGLLLTGGDVAAGVLAGLGAVGVQPVVEVAPLAVQGRIVGGPWADLPLATKGGLVGDDETLVRCIDQLAVGTTSDTRLGQFHSRKENS